MLEPGRGDAFAMLAVSRAYYAVTASRFQRKSFWYRSGAFQNQSDHHIKNHAVPTPGTRLGEPPPNLSTTENAGPVLVPRQPRPSRLSDVTEVEEKRRYGYGDRVARRRVRTSKNYAIQFWIYS